MGPRADERCYLNVSATPFLHFPSYPTAPIFSPACHLPHLKLPPSPPTHTYLITSILSPLNCHTYHHEHTELYITHNFPLSVLLLFIIFVLLNFKDVHGCGRTGSFQLSFAFVCRVLPPLPPLPAPSLPLSVLPSINQVPFLHLLHQSSSGHGVPP